MRHDVIDDVASLVKPGSVHRRLYDDPAIFELELERVFGSAWIYVGHESQVKQPGVTQNLLRVAAGTARRCFVRGPALLA